jgi:hypothetical protein
MALLWGTSIDGDEVPVQVDSAGRVVARLATAPATVVHTTASLTPGGSEDFTLPGGNLFQLLAVSATTPAWLRVYGSSAARAADLRTEPGGTPPGPAGEYYAELATTTPGQVIRLAPVPLVQGANGEGFVRVQNRDSSSRVIVLDFSLLTLLAGP